MKTREATLFNESMDNTENYEGPTKRSEFYLFDDSWPEFKKLIDEVDRIYEEIA